MLGWAKLMKGIRQGQVRIKPRVAKTQALGLTCGPSPPTSYGTKCSWGMLRAEGNSWTWNQKTWVGVLVAVCPGASHLTSLCLCVLKRMIDLILLCP